MTQDDQDHIVIFVAHRPGPAVCGSNPRYTPQHVNRPLDK